MSQTVTIEALQEKRKDGDLVGFRCDQGHTYTSPVKRCPKCASKTFETVDLPSTGEVVTFTIQNVAAEEFMNETPFAWAIIELDDGSRVTGWIPFVASEKDLAIGDRVEVDQGYNPGTRFKKL